MSLAEQDLAGGGHGTAAGAPPANTDPHTGEVVPHRSLAENEEIIDRGLSTFFEVGAALAEIRDAGLYLETHGDFDTYCRERWGFDRTYAHRLIGASEIADVLPIGNKPQTESQARALNPVKDDPEKMREAMELAVAKAKADGAKVTADRIAGAVDEVLGNEPPPPPEPPAEMTDAERKALERSEAIDRAARRLRKFLDSFDQLVTLASHPLRDEILDHLAAPDRERVLNLEKELFA